MLSSGNSGKYLYGRYIRERGKALVDKTTYSTDELNYLDISGAEGGGEYYPDAYRIDTQPLDQNILKQHARKKNAIDIRKCNKMGGDV